MEKFQFFVAMFGTLLFDILVTASYVTRKPIFLLVGIVVGVISIVLLKIAESMER